MSIGTWACTATRGAAAITWGAAALLTWPGFGWAQPAEAAEPEPPDAVTPATPGSEPSSAASAVPAGPTGDSAAEVSAEELAEIQQAVGADAAAVDAGSEASEAPADPADEPGFFAGAADALLPEISLILDAAFAVFSEEEPLQTGGHDPTETGFNLQQLELSMYKNVDPYFRFDTNIVFSLFGVELEEAYGTTLDLPLHLQVRAGQFLTRFGRINASHPHGWDFVDQPFMHGKVFGGEGNRGLGVELSWLTPLPWFVEIVGSTTGAAGEASARSFYGAENGGVE